MVLKKSSSLVECNGVSFESGIDFESGPQVTASYNKDITGLKGIDCDTPILYQKDVRLKRFYKHTNKKKLLITRSFNFRIL